VRNSPHIPVLYREVSECFSGMQSGVMIDCTLGYGGHSALILEANPGISLVGIDQDQSAIEFSTERLAPFGERVRIVKGRFASVISDVVADVGAENVCGILADIGVSSLQLDLKERGFSYESDHLDMRMNPDAPLSAADVVNDYSQDALERVLRDYAELRNYRKMASVIVQRRPFYSAKELAEAIKPYAPRGKKIHPATLVMQAIRIEVNNELGELRDLLRAIEALRLSRAKVAIISFHSLEDRIVKQQFARWSKSCICPSDAMRCVCGNHHAVGTIRTKKPITAQEEELRENPRSRSAKMRIFIMDNERE